MEFFYKIFGPNLETQKIEAFKLLEQQFKDSDIKTAKANWLTVRGNNHAIARRFGMAITDFIEALRFEANRPSTLISLGGAYNHKGLYKEGISTLENAKTLLVYVESDFLRNVAEYNLYYELGNAYFFCNDKEKAVHHLLKSTEKVKELKGLKIKNLISDEEWINSQKMLSPMIKNTEWLLARIRLQ